MTVQAYMDESGIKGTHPIFVFAGFLGRAERWVQFSSEWSAWLALSPAISYLKMNEAVKLVRQFRGWGERERNEKLRGCITILKKYPQLAIHVSVNIKDFQQSMADAMPDKLRDPYFLAFFGILAGVCYELLDMGVPEAIEVIFDEHSIFRPRVNAWYSWMRDNIGEFHDYALQRVLPPSPIFKDDKELVPLQAADVLAWLFRNALSGNRNEFEWMAEELSPVIPMSQYATVYDAERMENVHRLTDEMARRISPRRAWEFAKVLGIKKPKRGLSR